MDDSLPDAARSSAAAVILAKRDQLLRERAVLQEQRAALLSRTRRNDRELSDCRAAARLFQVDVEFPSDDDDSDRELRRRYIRDMEERHRNASMHNVGQTETAVSGPLQNLPKFKVDREPSQGVGIPIGLANPLQKAAPASPKNERPSLRVFLLDQLKNSQTGSKAAPLRELFERTYGEMIHEKTVGMTLYRLAKEGSVRREGHQWFFVPPRAETENPDAGASGSTNEAT